MATYTPTTEKVRLRYTAMRSQATGDPVPEIEAEFNRWLQATITEAAKPLERMVQALENENARLQQELAEAETRLADRTKTRGLAYPASEHLGLTEQRVSSEFAFAVAGNDEDRFEMERKRALQWVNHLRAEARDEGHEDGQHNEHEYRPGRQLTNPYRIGGDVQ